MSTRNAPPRSTPPSTPLRVRFDRFELDEANATLTCNGSAVSLAPTPFAVLCALARQPAALLTKNALLDQIWGHQFVSDSVLKTAISDLRAALGDDARRPRFIETVSRRGYRFVAATNEVAASSSVRAISSQIRPPQMPSFIGRAEALSQLCGAWDRACTGAHAIVWVAGEPGIGKTTLIEQFVAGMGDVAVARGQCVEHYGTGEPYLPVLEALGELCRTDSALPALLRAVAPTWLIQLPWLIDKAERDGLRLEQAGLGTDRMLREMGELLDRYSEKRPLLLVTEDLHWSDRSTVQLIDYIARRRGSRRLLWLASFRIAEVVALDHPLNALRHELRMHGLCEEIMLDPFSEAEVAKYVEHRLPSLARDEAFVRSLHERTDGVPLFVASVVGDVMTRDVQGDQEGASQARVANLAVPDNLAGIIDHYIAKLGTEQRLLLSAAAVCGVQFRADMLAQVLDRDAVWIVERCDQLAREQLWLAAPRIQQESSLPEAPYSFRHVLFRQVLYERTPPSARAELHRKAGAALERERAAGAPVAATELAMHFERGHEPMAAVRFYAEAAEAALAHLSPRECMRLAEHGLSLLAEAPQGTERTTLEFSLATLQGASATQALGFGCAAKNAFQRAYALLGDVPKHPMRGLLLHGFGFVLSQRTEYAEALAVAERAGELSATNDPALVLAVCTVQGHAHMLQGRPRSARTWLEKGLALMESLDAKPEQISVADPQVFLLSLLGIQLFHLGLVRQARTRLSEAHERARRMEQPMARIVALWCDALLEVRLGNAQRVAQLGDELCALVDEFALAQGRAACKWFRAWAEARMGQPREAYRRIRDAYAENIRLGMLAGGSENLGYAAEALFLAGDADAAQKEIAEALEFARVHEERVYLPQLLLTNAAIARARGEHEAAGDSVRRALAEARAQEAPWLELLALVALCEEGSATTQDRQELAALLDQLSEARDTVPFAKAQSLLDAKKPARARLT